MNQIARTIPPSFPVGEREALLEHQKLSDEVNRSQTQANIINLRRANMAAGIVDQTLKLTAAYATFYVAAYAGKIPQLLTVAPAFPIAGVLLCIVLLLRDRVLFRVEGRFIGAAMKFSRDIWEGQPDQLRRSSAYTAAVTHVDDISNSMPSATFWPLMWFIMLVFVETFFGKMLHIPANPV